MMVFRKYTHAQTVMYLAGNEFFRTVRYAGGCGGVKEEMIFFQIFSTGKMVILLGWWPLIFSLPYAPCIGARVPPYSGVLSMLPS